MYKNIARVGMGLMLILFFSIGCDKDNPVDPKDTHNEAEGLTLKLNGSTLVVVKEGKVQQGEISVKSGERTGAILVQFLDPHGDEFTPTEAGSSLGLTTANTEIAETEGVSGSAWEFVVKGKKAGATSLVIKLRHGDHADFTTPAIPVQVGQ